MAPWISIYHPCRSIRISWTASTLIPEFSNIHIFHSQFSAKFLIQIWYFHTFSKADGLWYFHLQLKIKPETPLHVRISSRTDQFTFSLTHLFILSNELDFSILLLNMSWKSLWLMTKHIVKVEKYTIVMLCNEIKRYNWYWLFSKG